MSERQKPLVTVRGRDTYLSIWVSGNNVKISVSRKGQGGFERIDSYLIPLDYLLFKVIEASKDIVARYCEFVSALEEIEEKG